MSRRISIPLPSWRSVGQRFIHSTRLDGHPRCIGQFDLTESGPENGMTTLSPIDYAVISQALIAGAPARWA